MQRWSAGGGQGSEIADVRVRPLLATVDQQPWARAIREMPGPLQAAAGAEQVVVYTRGEAEAAQGPLVVAGRVEVIRRASFRAVWIRHDGVKRLLMVEPSQETWPMLDRDQTAVISSARVVVPGPETRDLFPWTRISRRSFKRLDVLLVTDDDHITVAKTRQF